MDIGPVVQTLKWCLELFRPAIFTSATGFNTQNRRTSHLDGLRGFAALIVYLFHHEGWIHTITNEERILASAFGYGNNYYFACLPGVRIIFAGGHFAVGIFFVISGYVLSTKPLMCINAGEYSKLGEVLSSSLFRRWLRLYIPIIFTTFIYMTSWHFLNIHATPDPKGNYWDEIYNWYIEFRDFSFIFRDSSDPSFTYNRHTWSVPAEFKGSIVIYTALMAFSRCTRNCRLWCGVGLIVYFLYIVDGWFCAMFLGGMLLCDLDLLAERNNLPDFFAALSPFKGILFYLSFFVSIYLGGVPYQSGDGAELRVSPGWYYISFLQPQAVTDCKWFYLFWASIFLVTSISRIRLLKVFFEGRFNQYLGRISYALYLVHGPVLWLLGSRMYAATGWSGDCAIHVPACENQFSLPKNKPMGLEMSFLLPHLILLPVTLWMAEIVTRLFDQTSVQFSQWLYGKMLL
ncbi:acyltransferase family-domain-containing protein [Talaromyces proteolyticus]|uniref:Acyltransferase family-domain-containing protein n=1 Tax=Talaromyces proteolyticus TaxID=1131652 RepID=A0AAD4KLI4_9EURO|nr:acyltransferase family-domain-containing protein [Talaromyces proteolyticus]KAH8693979.1 acyltransferase family-domain-containing protein [Talaromyces proteolyticus]